MTITPITFIWESPCPSPPPPPHCPKETFPLQTLSMLKGFLPNVWAIILRRQYLILKKLQVDLIQGLTLAIRSSLSSSISGDHALMSFSVRWLMLTTVNWPVCTPMSGNSSMNPWWRNAGHCWTLHSTVPVVLPFWIIQILKYIINGTLVKKNTQVLGETEN